MSTIEVHVRMLPINGESAWWTGPTHITPKMRPELTFPFSHVHNPCCTNKDLFHALSPIVSQVNQTGSNVTIMAYGQTGSGKTYTMIGEERKDEGIFFLAAEVLIKDISSRLNIMSSEFREYLSEMQEKILPADSLGDTGKKKEDPKSNGDMVRETIFGLRCAYLEIYNEQIRDLLQSPAAEVEIKEGFKDAMHLDKLSWHSFASIEALRSLIAQGELSRATSATSFNIHSSRSHTILTIERVKLVYEKSQSTGKRGVRVERVAGQLHLVDLAGSECARLAATTGTNLREGGFINKSLLSLGNVVDSIVEGRSHIPYRESKLTRILSNSLGVNKNSRTAIICCINPDPSNLEQSLAGLRFAQRASKVVVHPKVLGTQPPSCILQLIYLAKQSRADGKPLLKQLYAAGVHDSSYLVMRSTKKYMDMLTHLFVDEFNSALGEYCFSLQSIGAELTAKREELRNEIEELQRQVLHLEQIGEHEVAENENLCSRLRCLREDICQEEEAKERLEIACEALSDLVQLHSWEFDAIKECYFSSISKKQFLFREAFDKAEKVSRQLEGEKIGSEHKHRSEFLDAENQRAARKQCDYIDMEKAEIEHKIITMEEQYRAEQQRLKQRKTAHDYLTSRKEQLGEIESVIDKRRADLHQLQQIVYGSSIGKIGNTTNDEVVQPSVRETTELMDIDIAIPTTTEPSQENTDQIQENDNQEVKEDIFEEILHQPVDADENMEVNHSSAVPIQPHEVDEAHDDQLEKIFEEPTTTTDDTTFRLFSTDELPLMKPQKIHSVKPLHSLIAHKEAPQRHTI